MSARKRPGPVPKDPAERRTVAVMARISPAEHERLINALAAENRRIATAGETPYTAVSDVVREALREWCAKVEASTPVPTIWFGPVENDDGYRTCAVMSDSGQVGELYREPGMSEWAADGALEALYGENVAAGYNRVRDAQKALLSAHEAHYRKEGTE